MPLKTYNRQKGYRTVAELAVTRYESVTDLDSIVYFTSDQFKEARKLLQPGQSLVPFHDIRNQKFIFGALCQNFGRYFEISLFASLTDTQRNTLKYFIVHLLQKNWNRLIPYTDYNVWIGEICSAIVDYMDYILKAQDAFEDLHNASTNLTDTTKVTYTHNENGNNSSSTTGKVTSDVDSTSVGSANANSKDAASDYPQSMVNLSVTAPQSLDWTYASAGSENISTTSNNQDTNSQSNTDSTGSSSGEFATVRGGTTETNHDRDTITQFDYLMKMFEFYSKNGAPLWAKVTEYFNKYFMGVYPDEDRYLYLLPGTDIYSVIV